MHLITYLIETALLLQFTHGSACVPKNQNQLSNQRAGAISVGGSTPSSSAAAAGASDAGNAGNTSSSDTGGTVIVPLKASFTRSAPISHPISFPSPHIPSLLTSPMPTSLPDPHTLTNTPLTDTAPKTRTTPPTARKVVVPAAAPSAVASSAGIPPQSQRTYTTDQRGVRRGKLVILVGN